MRDQRDLHLRFATADKKGIEGSRDQRDRGIRGIEGSKGSKGSKGSRDRGIKGIGIVFYPPYSTLAEPGFTSR